MQSSYLSIIFFILSFFTTSNLFAQSLADSQLFNLSPEEEQRSCAKDLKHHVTNPIIYRPGFETKASITVLTDMDCGYCRKFHYEIPRLLELGIEVRYMAFPRGGIGSDSYNMMVSIWCSDNMNEAMDKAMSGEYLPQKKCSNPIREHFMLGRKWGISGTPTIVYSDGTLSPGYKSAERIAREAILHKE